MRETGEGDRIQTDEGWTKRVNRGTTAVPSQSYPPHSVQPDDGSTLGEQGDAGGNCKIPVEWPALFTCHSNPEKPRMRVKLQLVMYNDGGTSLKLKARGSRSFRTLFGTYP